MKPQSNFLKRCWNRLIESDQEAYARKKKALGYECVEFNTMGTKPKAVDWEFLIGVFGILLALPFRLLWNILVCLCAVGLTIAWLGFVFGSVIGVVLLLIFMPSGFLFPLGLLSFTIRLIPEKN